MGNIVVYVTGGRDAPQIDENKQEVEKAQGIFGVWETKEVEYQKGQSG